MKKIISFITTMMLIFSLMIVPTFADEIVPTFADESDVLVDNADLIVVEDEKYFEDRIQKIEKEYGYRITFVSKGGFTTEEEARDYSVDHTTNYYSNKSKSNDSGVIIYFNVFEDGTYIDSPEYYGRYAQENDIFYDTVKDIQEIEKNTETYADFLDGYITTIENYIIEKKSLPDEVRDNVGTTDLIGKFDPVVDAANLLTDSEEKELFNRISEINKKYDFDVTFLTMNKLPDGGKLKTYCDWYEGVDINRDGVIFAINIDPENRSMATSTRNEGIKTYNSAALARIDEDLVPVLKSEDYVGAVNSYLDLSVEFLEAASTGEYYEPPVSAMTKLIALVIVPLVIALLIATFVVHGILVPQMKTAEIKNEAKSFVKKDSFNLVVNQDTFIRQSETRTLRPKDSDNDSDTSSGSGGDRGGSETSF